MTNQQMITAIISSIQTDENVIILMRLVITNNIGNLDILHLQAICQALGINTSG